MSEYGANHEALTALRHPATGQDFYHLLTKAEQFVTVLESSEWGGVELPGDVHYLMAVLVKGGLFQKGKGR